MGPNHRTSGLNPKMTGDDEMNMYDEQEGDVNKMSIDLDDIKLQEDGPRTSGSGMLQNQRKKISVNLKLDNLKVPAQDKRVEDNDSESLSALLSSMDMKKTNSVAVGGGPKKRVSDIGFKIELGGTAAGDALDVYGHGTTLQSPYFIRS